MGEWSKREKEVMGRLRLARQPGSGNGWLKKEDGESEVVLCQLKSTKGNQITIKWQDVMDLVAHAQASSKVPIFAIDFVGKGLLVSCFPGDLSSLSSEMGDKWKGVMK